MSSSPYLKDNRLASVIAAIQVMANQPWGSRSIDLWIRNLEGVEDLATADATPSPTTEARERWKEVFEQHPEFFKLYKVDGEVRCTLRWRFALPINFDPKKLKVVSENELSKLTTERKYKTLTRQPLTTDQIGLLITTAIEMHEKAASQKYAYLPVIGASVAAILGGILTLAGVLIAGYFGWSHKPV